MRFLFLDGIQEYLEMILRLRELCVISNQVITFLLLLASQCYVSANENVYKRTKDTVLSNTFKTLSSATRVACCAYCDQTVDCMSISYQNSSKTCKLSNDALVAVNVNGQTDSSWDTYSKNDWVLVFRGTPGIGGDTYHAWIDGNDVSVSVDDVTCMTTDTTSCSKNYRNQIIDSWSMIGLEQVKFAFYKANAEVAYVIFNATGSNITNWFSVSNILKSSWTTIATDTFNYFSIQGHGTGRRFFINRHYGGCAVDTGYSVIVAEGTQFQCAYDIHTSYPQFIYSNSATFGSPETMTGMDKADVVAVFIK